MKRLLVATTLAAGLLASPAVAQTFLGEMRQFQRQCPQGWMKAQGQSLQVVAYQAVFSLVGTKFGGDGKKTFMLPRLDDAQPGTIWCFSVVEGRYPPPN